ncbi:MAG: NifB/NifX family molybdenum-iron cluster-binding protein [Bacillota bacterium]
MPFLIAFATDDGQQVIERHFGDACFYEIYRLTPAGSEYLNRVDNTSGEERQHADPRKARSVVSLLKEQGVKVGVSHQFGPNLKRVKKHFVPVIIQETSIKKALIQLQQNFNQIQELWEQGPERQHLKLE